MRELGAIVVQLILSAVVTGAVLPLAIVAVPGVRSASVGPYVAVVVAAASFFTLRAVWPRKQA
jgi:hypothetical protein